MINPNSLHNLEKHNAEKALPPHLKSLYQTRFYKIWSNMKNRCDSPKSTMYFYYGGRGITYNKRWSSFANFYDDMYFSYKENLTLDRIDNNSDYKLSNCRWITMKEQCINRSNTRLFEYNGEKFTLTDWAIKLGKKRSTLSMRYYKYGWPIERILGT